MAKITTCDACGKKLDHSTEYKVELTPPQIYSETYGGPPYKKFEFCEEHAKAVLNFTTSIATNI